MLRLKKTHRKQHTISSTEMCLFTKGKYEITCQNIYMMFFVILSMLHILSINVHYDFRDIDENEFFCYEIISL